VNANGSGQATSEGRLIDSLLASYAAGTLSEPLAVLVASHLQIKADNRLYVENLEAAGGMLLDEIEPVPLPDRDRRLASVQSMCATIEERGSSGAKMTNDLMPPALRAYFGNAFDACSWRALLPGIKQCLIAKDAAAEVSFLRCRAGKTVPAHAHDGFEAALVLAGGLRDASGQYARGDIIVADDTIVHQPVIDRDVECIVFLVLEGSVRLTSPFGRLVQLVIG
jgi:putative transcriptional regulator